jgi:hypothetical protein
MGNKCVFIGEDGIPNVEKITLERIYDSSLNEEFVKLNDDAFSVDDHGLIQVYCGIKDSENCLLDGEHFFQGESLGKAFEKFAACNLLSISEFPNQRYTITANSATGVFRLYSTLLLEQNVLEIKKIFDQGEILKDVISQAKWTKREVEKQPEFHDINDIFQYEAERLEESASETITREMLTPERGKLYRCTLPYIMQFPKRYQSIWVLNCSSWDNYSDNFTYSWNSTFDKIRVSPILNDRPYTWLLNTFLGTDGKEPLFPRLSLCCSNIEINCVLLDTILADGDIHYVDLWYTAPWDDSKGFFLAKYDLPLWLSFLKSNIEIEFVSESKMESISRRQIFIEPLIKRNPDDSIINVAEVMETLGCYIDRKIFICTDRILRCAKELKLSEEILFYVVYIHELAHAAMDDSLDAYEHPEDYYSDAFYHLTDTKREFGEGYVPFSLTDQCSLFMEESLANMITLNYLSWYSEVSEDQKFYDSASLFVKQQSPMYAFGQDQFDAGVDWTKWRTYKYNNVKADEKLLNWYNKIVNEDGTRNDYKYSKIDFDEIFE